jgi:hypothetical protein
MGVRTGDGEELFVTKNPFLLSLRPFYASSKQDDEGKRLLKELLLCKKRK